MSYTPKTPEGMLADNESFVEQNGAVIRKGSFAALIANADIVQAEDSTEQEKQLALQEIKKLADGGLKAFNMHKYLRWNDSRIDELFQLD